MNNQQIESQGSVQPDARATAPQHSRQRRRLAVVAGLALSVGLPTLGMTCLPAIAAAAPQPAAQQDAAGGIASDKYPEQPKHQPDNLPEFKKLPAELKTVAELDAAIAQLGSPTEVAQQIKDGTLPQEKQKLFLQRSLVQDAGYDALKSFAQKSQDHSDFLQWLLSDFETLKLYVTGGAPGGADPKKAKSSHERSIQQFMDIARAYADGLKEPTPAADRAVYKKMMIAAALGMSDTTRLWIGNDSPIADHVERYHIVKTMRANAEYYGFQKDVFDQLKVQNMRWIFEDRISNEEMPWLSNYSRARFPTDANQRRNAYNYIEYRTDFNDYGGYNDPDFFDKKSLYEEAISQEPGDAGQKIAGGWKAKYMFEYDDPNFPNKKVEDPYYYYQYYTPGEKLRLWMPFEDGGVCGALGKTTENLYNLVGLPAAEAGQPKHSVCLIYRLVEDPTTHQLVPRFDCWGKVWDWLNTNLPNAGNVLCGWKPVHSVHGEKESDNPNNKVWGGATFSFMAQDALNNLDDYAKVLEILELVESQTDRAAKVDLLNKALEVQPYNLDVFEAYINLYASAGTKATAAEWEALADKVVTGCANYPYPMHSLLVRIGQEQDQGEAGNSTRFSLERKRLAALEKAKTLTEQDTIWHKEAKEVANSLLGARGAKMFEFSFDGEDAGVLKLGEQFSSYQVTWEYSLDGGKTWETAPQGSNRVKLSDEQLAKVNATDDIRFKVSGVADDASRIDITEAPAPTGYAANNFDHRIHGMDGKPADAIDVLINGTWVQNTEDSIFSGDQTLEIRQRAFGTSVPSRETSKITFTTAWNAPEGVMVPLKEMRINSVSSTHGNMKPEYVIDGYTSASAGEQQLWHSNAEASGPWITVDLGKERDLTHVDMWVRCDRPGNGVPYEVEVLTAPEQNLAADAAVDASKFTVAGKFGNFDWQNPTAGMPAEMRRLTFEQPVRARYVRVHATNCRGNFFTLQELAFFERAGQ